MTKIFGDKAYVAAKKNTMKKMNTLRKAVLKSSKRRANYPCSEGMIISFEIPTKKKK